MRRRRARIRRSPQRVSQIRRLAQRRHRRRHRVFIPLVLVPTRRRRRRRRHRARSHPTPRAIHLPTHSPRRRTNAMPDRPFAHDDARTTRGRRAHASTTTKTRANGRPTSRVPHTRDRSRRKRRETTRDARSCDECEFIRQRLRGGRTTGTGRDAMVKSIKSAMVTRDATGR